MNGRNVPMLCLACLMAFLACSTTHAGVVVWPDHPDGEPHAYLLVEAGEPDPDFDLHWDWDNARDLAWGTTFPGMPEENGYLATITSDLEQQFIEDYVLTPEYDDPFNKLAWIGGVEPQDDGNWEWITDEPWDFENWAPGEANDLDGADGASEDYLQMYRCDSPYEYGYRYGQWNDALLSSPAHQRHHGYLVEFSVPEPATLSLLAFGGLALLRRKR